MSVEYWSPTRARPTEGRISTISKIPPLASIPSSGLDDDPLFLLLILETNQEFIVRYPTRSELIQEWHPDVWKPVVASLERARARAAAMGWIDLKNGTEYLHS